MGIPEFCGNNFKFKFNKIMKYAGDWTNFHQFQDPKTPFFPTVLFKDSNCHVRHARCSGKFSSNSSKKYHRNTLNFK